MKRLAILALPLLSFAYADGVANLVSSNDAKETFESKSALNAQVLVSKSVEIIAQLRNEIDKDITLTPAIVANYVAKYKDMSCEIVKAALDATKEKPEMLESIVQSACEANPENMRVTAQCAIAFNPDALASVQNVMAKLDPATGDKGISGKEVAEKGGMEKGGMEKAVIQPPAPEKMGDPLILPRTITVVPIHPYYVVPPKATNIGRPIYTGPKNP